MDALRKTIIVLLLLFSTPSQALLIIFDCGKPKYVLGEHEGKTVFVTFNVIKTKGEWQDWFINKLQTLPRDSEGNPVIDKWHEEVIFNKECPKSA